MHFDWSTLVLQTVNVVILLWLLRRFLFRPIVAMIAERRNAAEKLLADAAAACDRAQSQVEQTARREKALSANSARIMAEARAAAETERAALLERSKTEVAKVQDAAQANLEQQRGQMRRELEVEARQLAVSVASRLLGRIPASAMNTALVEALGTLPAAEWRSLATPEETLEVVTASPLDAAAQTACSDMVRQRLGCSVRFATDSSLIAGVELRGLHARLRNNWRADLDKIAEELSLDDKHLTVA